MFKHLSLLLLMFLFPIGIWLGLEGYELQALICLIVGWEPIAWIVADYIKKDREERNSKI